MNYIKQSLIFRCASISWFQVVSQSVSHWCFSASASTGLSELFASLYSPVLSKLSCSVLLLANKLRDFDFKEATRLGLRPSSGTVSPMICRLKSGVFHNLKGIWCSWLFLKENCCIMSNMSWLVEKGYCYVFLKNTSPSILSHVKYLKNLSRCSIGWLRNLSIPNINLT